MRERWQSELAEAYDSPETLRDAGFISADEADQLTAVAGAYRVRVPRYYARLMRREPACPIRAQALPSLHEVDPTLPMWARDWSRRVYGRDVPWSADAIGDIERLAAPRLTHRYGNRALMHLSAMCALYCRFCFRKSHLNAAEQTLYGGPLGPAFAYLQGHPEIRELILTGGDPLSLPDGWLAGLCKKIAEVRHIRHVRIHSRMAVTLPTRLTSRLRALLSEQPFGVTLVSHFNHPRECTPVAMRRLARLRRSGVQVLNQSVLLRGVNDRLPVLSRLFQGLYENGVIPYYLHQADWTPGTFHFRVSLARARRLAAALAGRLSGPACPSSCSTCPRGSARYGCKTLTYTSWHGARKAVSVGRSTACGVRRPARRAAERRSISTFTRSALQRP